MDNKLLTFIKPYLSLIDNGHLYRRPFIWLYAIFAIINLIYPIYFFLNSTDDNHIFDLPAKYVIAFCFVWIIIGFASWISFQLWMDRKSKIINTSIEGDYFVVTPVVSHLIQTIGEWLGTWIGIVGFGTALSATIILGSEGFYFLEHIGLGFLYPRSFVLWVSIVLTPIYGYLIIVATRFLAELIRAPATNANKTKNN